MMKTKVNNNGRGVEGCGW